MPDNSQNCLTDMKKISLLLLLLLLPLCIRAQDRLKSGPVFDGSVIPKDRMIETYVKGGSIKDYGLTLFRSVRFEADDAEFQKISSLVLADVSAAFNKETEIEKGRLRCALMSFSPAQQNGEFLCFQARTEADGSCSVILVYMQGNTTLAELKKIFSKTSSK